ncbi:hypothetical protein BKA93DRAFT_361389 [Sparassis latifolia]
MPRLRHRRHSKATAFSSRSQQHACRTKADSRSQSKNVVRLPPIPPDTKHAYRPCNRANGRRLGTPPINFPTYPQLSSAGMAVLSALKSVHHSQDNDRRQRMCASPHQCGYLYRLASGCQRTVPNMYYEQILFSGTVSQTQASRRSVMRLDQHLMAHIVAVKKFIVYSCSSSGS